MKIILSYRTDTWKDRPVECYSRSYARILREREHIVKEIGDGHGTVHLEDLNQSSYDFFLEIENGRPANGKLRFQLDYSKCTIPSGIVLIDSHGHPDLHQNTAPNYNHVFFAVWRRRDLFSGHPSSHWLPNATDKRWFHPFIFNVSPKVDIGFFGSKGGLDRADILKSACDELGLTYEVRQVGKNYRHRWPYTCEAMLNCKMLFNKGQKHDGPNQRVMESMMCNRLLFNDIDEMDGMSKLFVEGEDYLGYKNEEHLKELLSWASQNTQKAAAISQKGHWKVKDNHQISNRVDQILEVYNANH